MSAPHADRDHSEPPVEWDSVDYAIDSAAKDAELDRLRATVARVDAEIRQACAAAIANPVGWGGPMVTSFAHTILRILNEDRATKGGDDAA